MSAPQLTVRVRLTLLYTVLFIATGATLIAISYGLVARLPAGTPTPSDQDLQQLHAFAVCMRAHQIDMSDPTPDGNMRIGGRLESATRAQVEIDPGYVAAREACRGEEPSLSPCPMENEQQRTACKLAAQQGAEYQRDRTLAHLLQYSLLTLVASTVLAAVAGWIVAGRVLRPVSQIAAAARAASEHNLSARVALRGPRDELRELADTFDSMLARLEAAFESQRRFIANAGHELRTPLTVMRTTVDVVLARPGATTEELRAMGRDVGEAVDQADRLITSLLVLARSEHGRITREPVDLSTVVEDTLDRTDLGDRQLHLTVQPAMTSGDVVLLERLVANLIDNAVRYNLPGGDVWVATTEVDGDVNLVVANTGPVIEQDVEALFEPFHRAQGRVASHGFGLGLGLVAAIAAAHKGTVIALPRPGGGLTVTVTIPAVPPVGVRDD